MAGTRKSSKKNGLSVDVPELAGKVKKTATKAAGEAGDVLGEVKDKVAEGAGVVFEAVKERLPGGDEPKRRSRSSNSSSGTRKSAASSSTRSKSTSTKSRASASSTRSGGSARAAKKS